MRAAVAAHLESQPAPSIDEMRAELAKIPEFQAPTAGKKVAAFAESVGRGVPVVGSYVPEINAAISTVINPNRGLDKDLEAKGFKINQDNSFAANLASEKARIADQEAQMPVATGTGKFIGSVSGFGAAAKALPVATTALGRIAQSGGLMAAEGALQNPKVTDPNGSYINPQERYNNANSGLGIGIVAGAAGEAIGKGFSKASDALEARANRNFAAATGGKTADFKAMDRAGGQEAVGQTLKEQKVVPIFATPEKVANNIESAISKNEDKLGALIDAATEKAPGAASAQINPQKVAETIKDGLRQRYSGVPEAKLQPALDEVDSWLSQLGDNISISDAQKLKVQMRAFLKDADFGREMGIAKEGTKAVRSGLRQSLEDSVDSLSNEIGASAGALKETNQTIGRLEVAKRASEKASARIAGNRGIGLTDTIAAMGGVASGAAPLEKAALGGAFGAINKFARTFGDSVAAHSEDAIARAMSKVTPGGATTLFQGGASQYISPNEQGSGAIDRALTKKGQINRTPAKGGK